MKKALVFYGGWDGHTPVETANIYQEILEKNGYEVTMSDTLSVLDNYDDIKEYDLFVPMWTMGEIGKEQCQNICMAVENGAGIAGCHGGMCDSFRNHTNWQFMTGAQWVAHPGNDKATYTVNMKKCNPFTGDLDDFTYTGEQYYIHVDPAINVYATTDFPTVDGPHAANGKVTMPVVFTKLWGKGKVFYSSMGHTFRDFDIPQVKTIMERGLLWATR
ncbi:MAG: ThuA domain-containing protein [Clostridia bacterium]|nr:ThuA domain-containing protein [Clostridia bacterium]